MPDRYSIAAYCVPKESDSTQLSILLFQSRETNYTYIAETNLKFKILRFKIFQPRDLVVRPLYVKSEYRTDDDCPLCVVKGGHATLYSYEELSRCYETAIAGDSDPLFSCQIRKLFGSQPAELIFTSEKLAEKLELTGSEKREFVAAQIFDADMRSRIWSDLEMPLHAPATEQLEYKDWSGEQLSEWLSTWFENDGDDWYQVFKFFNEFRMPNNDVVRAELRYLDVWSNNNDARQPVGRVIEHLLGIDRSRIPGADDTVLEAIASGFSSGRFFLLTTDTPWWKRIEFHKRLTAWKEREARADLDRTRYSLFLEDFLVGFSNVLFETDFRIVSDEPIVRVVREDDFEAIYDDFTAVVEEELKAYLESFLSLAERDRNFAFKFPNEAKAMYRLCKLKEWHRWQKAWASALKRCRMQPPL